MSLNLIKETRVKYNHQRSQRKIRKSDKSHFNNNKFYVEWFLGSFNSEMIPSGDTVFIF